MDREVHPVCKRCGNMHLLQASRHSQQQMPVNKGQFTSLSEY